MQDTRIYLNNSNSKWLTIGVNLDKPEFYTDIFIQGDKCKPFKLGVNGLNCLVAELAQHAYFREEFGVSIYTFKKTLVHFQ